MLCKVNRIRNNASRTGLKFTRCPLSGEAGNTHIATGTEISSVLPSVDELRNSGVRGGNVPPERYAPALTLVPVSQSVGNRVSAEPAVERRLPGWAVSRYDWAPQNRREMLCEDENALGERRVTGDKVGTGLMTYRPRNARDWQPQPQAREGRGRFSPGAFGGTLL